MFPEGRMLDFLIVGVIALIVVGPKDLPVLMRKVGKFVGKMRGMANEFRASFDELARQSELEDLRKEVEAMRISQQSVVAQFNPLADSSVFDDISHHMSPSIPDGTAMTALQSAEPVAAEAAAVKPVRAARAKARAKPVGTVKAPAAKAKPAAPKTAPKPAPTKARASKPRPKTATTSDAS